MKACCDWVFNSPSVNCNRPLIAITKINAIFRYICSPQRGEINPTDNVWQLESQIHGNNYFAVTRDTNPPGGGGTPLFGLYGDVPLDKVWFFGLAVLNMVYNLTCLCPKQGMVLRAERLQPRLRAVSFFS